MAKDKAVEATRKVLEAVDGLGKIEALRVLGSAAVLSGCYDEAARIVDELRRIDVKRRTAGS